MAGDIRLVTLAAGVPQPLVDKHGVAWVSAIGRRPVGGPVRLTRDGLEGDRSRWEGHHRPSMKLHLFPAEHYPPLEALYGRPLPRPAFGENVIVAGYTETTARPGDLLRLGTALVRVTMPNERCANVGRFLHEPRMLKWLNRDRRTGFFAAVVEDGVVAPDSPIVLESAGETDWTIERLNHALLVTPEDSALTAEILALPVLAEDWKTIHRKHHARAMARAAAAAPTLI